MSHIIVETLQEASVRHLSRNLTAPWGYEPTTSLHHVPNLAYCYIDFNYSCKRQNIETRFLCLNRTNQRAKLGIPKKFVSKKWGIFGRGIGPLWPDLAKFRHFGNILKVLGDYMKVYLVLSKNLNLLWATFYAIGQISVVANGLILTKNLAIWSHWIDPKFCRRRL